MENLRKERLLDVIASFESKGGSDQGDYIDINGILYDIIGAMKEYCAGADEAISDSIVCSIKKLIKYKAKYSEREKMLMEIWFNEANINDFLELLITAVRDYCNGSNEISKEFVEAMKKMIFMRRQFIYMDYLEKLVFDYLFRYPTDSKPAEFVGGAKAEDFIRYLAQINVLNIDTRRSVLTCTAAYQYSTDTTDTIQNHPILVWLNDGRPALDEKDYDTSGASEADTEQVESEGKS